jgi:citrate/tricarballylate utilization protein
MMDFAQEFTRKRRDELHLDEVIAEADRQITICNACRYCEGYCAVFPAIERRATFTPGDIAHLSNLCHDCRACYYACMYAPPHEFAVNIPEILSKVRIRTYDNYLGAGSDWLRRRLKGRTPIALTAALSLVLFIAVAGATKGVSALWHRPSTGSPYEVIPYAVLIAIMLAPFLFSVGVILRAGARYWTATHGPLRDLWNLAALSQASAYAAQLHYLQGGGPNCYYPADVPSPMRRLLHSATAYGFVLCVIATTSAAIMQDIIGWQPPYGMVSLPVLSGIVGGAGLIVGSTGLIAMKARADREPGDELETVANYGFLVALDVLAATGILTLLLRHEAGFGIALVIHLAAVALCFLVAPYTKFVHFVYRYLALVKDSLEVMAQGV